MNSKTNEFAPELEKRIIEFFATKHMAVNVHHRDFNSDMYKSEQCNIEIFLNKKRSEVRGYVKGEPLNPIFYQRCVASFKLLTMPGCCGVVISTGCWVERRIQGYGIGQFLHQLRIWLAKKWGYTILMCTDVDTNYNQKHILDKNGWKNLYQFTNLRTNNLVNLHVLNLSELPSG